jgi:hypothetical protein
MTLSQWMLCLQTMAVGCLAASAPVQAQDRQGDLGDPFVQVTAAVAGCPVPRAPSLTPAQRREQAHVRAQHGGSCYRSGRCRLPSSYLYDQKIVPRVATYLRQDGRFDDTSVWVLGERRLVTLMGCVQSEQQAQAMERAVLLVDDVMGAVNQLMVGASGRPKYETGNSGNSGPAPTPPGR